MPPHLSSVLSQGTPVASWQSFKGPLRSDLAPPDARIMLPVQLIPPGHVKKEHLFCKQKWGKQLLIVWEWWLYAMIYSILFKQVKLLYHLEGAQISIFNLGSPKFILHLNVTLL